MEKYWIVTFYTGVDKRCVDHRLCVKAPERKAAEERAGTPGMLRTAHPTTGRYVAYYRAYGLLID